MSDTTVRLTVLPNGRLGRAEYRYVEAKDVQVGDDAGYSNGRYETGGKVLAVRHTAKSVFLTIEYPAGPIENRLAKHTICTVFLRFVPDGE